MKSFNFKRLAVMLLLSSFFLGACTKEEQKPEASESPKANALEKAEGSAGDVITVTGNDLAGIRTILFEKDSITAPFNPVLNNDNAIVFRVPDNASGGEQNIILTNSLNKQIFLVYKVIALPTVTGASNFNFVPNGPAITLIGNNLNDVTSVTLEGTTVAATIVSQAKTELVISFPATTANSAKLIITNSTGPVTTNQEFVNMNNAFKIFTDGYENGFVNGSWGPADISGDFFKSGTKSFKAGYNKGNWSADGFAYWDGLANMPEYKFLSFWVKGGSVNYTLYLTGDQRAGGYGNSDKSVPLNIPANVWTYFKLPMSTIKLWEKGGPMKQFGFWIEGPDAQDEAFYFDDVIFVK
jgi:hypothetical protein